MTVAKNELIVEIEKTFYDHLRNKNFERALTLKTFERNDNPPSTI